MNLLSMSIAFKINLITLGTFSRPMTSIVLKKVCAAILKKMHKFNVISKQLLPYSNKGLLPDALGKKQVAEILKHIYEMFNDVFAFLFNYSVNYCNK